MQGKVLIIDDDPALLRLMAMAFQAAGFGVVSADKHLGADEVLAKPFRMAELMKISKSVIAGGPQGATELGN